MDTDYERYAHLLGVIRPGHVVWWAEELGVSPKASQAEIKGAFRKKAASAHPDRGGSNDRMVRLNLAYSEAKQARS